MGCMDSNDAANSPVGRLVSRPLAGRLDQDRAPGSQGRLEIRPPGAVDVTGGGKGGCGGRGVTGLLLLLLLQVARGVADRQSITYAKPSPS
jgi:hypothetical protein